MLNELIGMEKNQNLQNKSNFTLEVFVKPNAKLSKIEWDKDTGKYIIFVSSPPTKGKANKEIVSILKKFFKAEQVDIIKGINNSTKSISIINGMKTKEIQDKY